MQSQIGVVFFVLSFLIVIFVSVAFFLKKYLNIQTNNTNNIRILESIQLGGKEKIYLVRVDEIDLLIGTSQNNVQTLHRFNNKLTHITEDANNKKGFIDSFQHVLANSMTKKYRN